MASIQLLTPRAATTMRHRISDLPSGLRDRWLALVEDAAGPVSPFLHPGYAEAAAQARADVEVAVAWRDGEAVAFMPYQRSRFHVGTAVGGRLCDVAGAITHREFSLDPREISRGAGLRLLRLRNVQVHDPWVPYLDEPTEAPFIDLSDGFEAYENASIDSGSSLMRQIAKRRRRLERDVGPIRFDWHTDREDVLTALLEWKSGQRRATRTPDVLALPWARRLVDALRSRTRDDFSCVVSALWADDVLCAAHMGVRTERVLHYWVPAYNVELSKHSPGLIALAAITEEAAARGIEHVDLGVGEERYKVRAASGSVPVASATLGPHPFTHAVAQGADEALAWIQQSRVGVAAKAAAKGLTRHAYAVRSALGGGRDASTPGAPVPTRSREAG